LFISISQVTGWKDWIFAPVNWLAVKIISEMTYRMSSRTLNPTISIHPSSWRPTGPQAELSQVGKWPITITVAAAAATTTTTADCSTPGISLVFWSQHKEFSEITNSAQDYSFPVIFSKNTTNNNEKLWLITKNCRNITTSSKKQWQHSLMSTWLVSNQYCRLL